MPIELTIANRQRKVACDHAWWQKTGDDLARTVVRNLRERMPAHLSPAFLRELDLRGGLSVVLVSNRQIRRMNREWRGIDRATDVLSFPLADVPPPAGLPWEVGEVVISLEKACEQAHTLGHSFEREAAFLFVHGMLHVLGFDHETPSEEKEMFSRQHEVLESLGLRR